MIVRESNSPTATAQHRATVPCVCTVDASIVYDEANYSRAPAALGSCTKVIQFEIVEQIINSNQVRFVYVNIVKSVSPSRRDRCARRYLSLRR